MDLGRLCRISTTLKRRRRLNRPSEPAWAGSAADEGGGPTFSVLESLRALVNL
jgi:hypothetical protein